MLCVRRISIPQRCSIKLQPT